MVLMALWVASVRMVQAQGVPTLAWEQSSPVTGFVITVDGVRNDVGLTPVAADGTCGCSIRAWFLGMRHEVIVSAYHALGETNGLPLIVGPTAAAGGAYAVMVGSSLTVNGSASVDATGAIKKYDWTWGDGTGSSDAGAFASHSYASAGTYTITLIVTDTDGASDTTTAIATVADDVPSPAATGVPRVSDVIDTAIWTIGSGREILRDGGPSDTVLKSRWRLSLS